MAIKNKILVIDDEPSLLEIIKVRLEFSGFEVKTAKNGVEGLEIAKKWTPSLILLDIMMPEMDGFTVLVKLKETKATKSIIIVMLTSKGEVESIEKALNLGAVDYIVKPFTPINLVDKIKKAIVAKARK
jgi:two-component system, OmpR family, alkaline phosphatase synthesis response regulator PhoP